MKIYFAGPIRSVIPDRTTLATSSKEAPPSILDALKSHGEVLSELAFQPTTEAMDIAKDSHISTRDVAWLDQSNVLVADVSQPSHGVGWEICYAEHVRKIPVLLLWCVTSGKMPSAMLWGNRYVKFITYDLSTDLNAELSKYFAELFPKID